MATFIHMKNDYGAKSQQQSYKYSK